ncbi:MAG: WbqC family protein [Ramlibacter sp.]|nr:WbqC family protein [Ramlibacter sp.]
MRLAVMQPYFFPYVGYFALAATCDRFVFYDDVGYIKNGWINRNRILLGREPAYITVPLLNASASKRIDEVTIANAQPWKRKMLESVRHGYANAPYFEPVDALVRSVLDAQDDRIAELAKSSVRAVCDYLEVATDFVASPAGYGNSQLRGAERVKDICTREAATEYWNLPGGRDLYAESDFASAGLALRFVQVDATPYPQFSSSFQPFLSIIDVLMHNAPAQVREMVAAGRGS